MAQLSKVKRLAFDAGWMRWGWPERVGGLGGSTLLRGYLGEALTARGLVEPGIYSMTEVLAPTMIDYARPELAADDGAPAAPRRRDVVPGLLRARHRQQPGAPWPAGPRRTTTAGASTARRCGRAWPSSPSAACCSPAPARPSPPTAASPRCSSTWTRPGITVRPIETMHGREEFCEVFFDDVLVPAERTLGDEGQGWAVAMDLLPFERSTALWHRGAYLHRRLEELLARPPAGRARARTRSARCSSSSSPSGPARAPPSTAWPPATGSAPRRRSTRSCWPPPSRRCSTSPLDGLADEVLLGDDAAQRALALGVPLLPGGHDLRRQRRDPAQHRRPPPPRPGSRPMMDDEERELFAKGIQHATADVVGRRRSTPPSTSSAGATPWPSTPRSHGRRRCSSTRARRGATSSALDVVLARPPSASTLDGSTAACVLPALGRSTAARRAGERRRAGAGPRPRRPRRREPRSSSPTARRRRPPSSTPPTLAPRPVEGLDPRLGLVEVDGDGVAAARGRSPVAGAWADAVAAGQRALAHELVGASRTMLRPGPRATPSSGSSSTARSPAFQAVRHRLAESLSPSRRPTRPRDAAWDRRHAAHRRAGQGRRRPQRPHRRPPLPAGAGRHRLHHRARRSTATSAGRSCSTACSATPARSPRRSAPTSSRDRAASPPSLPL